MIKKLAFSFKALILIISYSLPVLANFDQSHSAWTQVLKDNVTIKGHSSTVNYSSVKSNPTKLNNYLSSLEKISKMEYAAFTQNEQLAFLINAYNAFTIKLIIDHYPVKSIKDIGGLLSSPWKSKFFSLFGEKAHLDMIEHDIIRKKFDEPRIHFALICASKGCPALQNEAYVAARLNQQLDANALNFLSDTEKNRYVSNSKTLEISLIFKWYGDDFNKKHGSFEAFIAPLITKDSTQQSLIKEKKATIKYLTYDWNLNE